MKTYTGYSERQEVEPALQEACGSLAASRPAMVLFFSDQARFAAFSEQLHQRFPDSAVIGASTHASFGIHGFCRHGLQLAALDGDIQVSADVIREITRHPNRIYKDVVLDALESIQAPVLTARDTCCFVLNPAGTASEELVLDTLDRALAGRDIPVAGGSASAEECVSGEVSLNGSVFSNSSVFAFIHMERGHIGIYQENIFRPMGRIYEVTRADAPTRTLYELAGRPAAAVLCEALQVEEGKLAEALALHPFGRLLGDSLYIDEVERINPDHSITAYCRILPGSRLTLLELDDPLQVRQNTLQRIQAEFHSLDFSIMVHCFSRTQLFLRQGGMDGLTRDLAAGLGPYIGLTSHGEQMGDFQVNMTMLLLCFGDTCSVER